MNELEWQLFLECLRPGEPLMTSLEPKAAFTVGKELGNDEQHGQRGQKERAGKGER